MSVTAVNPQEFKLTPLPLSLPLLYCLGKTDKQKLKQNPCCDETQLSATLSSLGLECNYYKGI